MKVCLTIEAHMMFSGARKPFLAYRLRMSACFTWIDNSYLTNVISPRTGYCIGCIGSDVSTS